MRILVTGATGLLGSDIVKAAEKHGHTVVKACHSQRDGFVSVDLTTALGIHHLDQEDWDVLVHAAASRNPDECENHKDAAYQLNSWATEQLAGMALDRNAKMLYICTDYVFPGTKPPYAEDSPPTPINHYGQTKLEGEEAVLHASNDNISLRIPLLYGTAAGLELSAVLNSALKALSTTSPGWMEDSIVRYPTYTGDVAEAAIFLLEKQAGGIFHFTGEDKLTKYLILKVIAEIVGKPFDHIESKKNPPATEAPRPHDAHLSMERIKGLGFPPPMPFKDRVTQLLKEEGVIGNQ